MNQHTDLNKPKSDRKEHLETELNELLEAKRMVEGEIFQKYFATPIYKLKKSLKSAYDCDTLKQLMVAKGKHMAYADFFKQVDEIETRLKFVRHDLENL